MKITSKLQSEMIWRIKAEVIRDRVSADAFPALQGACIRILYFRVHLYIRWYNEVSKPSSYIQDEGIFIYNDSFGHIVCNLSFKTMEVNNV